MNPFATRVLALTSTFFMAGIVVSAQMLMPTATPVSKNAPLVPSATSVNRIIEQPTVDGTSITVATSPVLHPATTPKVVAMPQEAPRGAMVGYTYYDFQTNSSMARRLSYYEDGSDKYVQIVWMASKDPTRDPVSRAPGFNTARGSHYNFLDVNDPDSPIPGIDDWKKMESERAGWPSLVQFDDGSVGTPSHTPVRFFRNAGVGDDQFFEFAQVSTTADSALWPRAAVDGENNIHLIYNRAFPRTDPNIPINQVAYRRSTDGGSTWEPEILFTGPQALLPQGVTGPLPNGTGGDTYAITARGPNVVIAYTDSPLRCLTRKSTDYGRTWDDPNVGIRVIVGQNQTYIDSTEYANGDSIRVYSDTVPSPSSHMSIVIDSEGLAHYAIGQTLTYVIQTGLKNPTASDPRRGIIYDVEEDNAYQNTGIFYYRETDTLIYTVGLAAGGEWDGQGTIVSRRAYSGSSRYPSIAADANDNIYLAYTSFKNGDVLPMQIDTTPRWSNSEPDTLVDVDGLFGHIWLTHKLKNSPQWSAPKDATPAGVNSLFASACETVVDGRLYIGYSVSSTPGDRVTNVETDTARADIYMMAFPTSELNVVNSVGESNELQANVSIAPNPSNDRTRLHVESVTAGPITVSVVSVHGERIMQSTSPSAQTQWDLEIPTQQLASGAYMVVIEQGGASITRTLSVLR